MFRHRRLVASLVLLGTLLLTVGAAAAKDRPNKPPHDAPRITWSTRKVEQSLTPGQSATVVMNFTSSTDLQNVTLNVPGRLAKVMTISPASFDTLPANTATQVTLTMNVPANWKGNVAGVVQVRAGQRVVAQPLHVQLKVPRAAKAADAKSTDAKKAAEDKQAEGSKKPGHR